MSVAPPQRDQDVPSFCDELAIPGIVDIHTHFMPERLLRAVWEWFDAIRLEDGSPAWPITYREDDDTRVARLRTMGVRAFTALNYAHKAGMAEWLNGWTAEFSAAHPDCIASATFFPEPGVDAYVAEALERDVRVFKVHLQVGDYDPGHPLLQPVWRRLSAAGVAVVTHAGSGPFPGQHTGPGPVGAVLSDHPDLVMVIAHMGLTEYEQFLELALRFPNVHLDTTMAFTDYMERVNPYPKKLLPVLAEHPDRVVFGSDFPNIPHPYAHQLQAVVGLDLGDDWLRAVCHDNGARLLGVPPR